MPDQLTHEEIGLALAFNPFEGDRYGEFRELCDEVRVARKQHSCHVCAGAVNPGEQYRVTTAMVDGDMCTSKFCIHCLKAMVRSKQGVEFRFYLRMKRGEKQRAIPLTAEEKT